MTRVSTDKSVRSIRRQLGGDAPGLLTRLRRDALQALAARPLYRHTLIGGVPDDLRVRIALRWPGDAKRGAAIAGGEIELGGELIRHPAPRWLPPSAGPEWMAAWHGFGWIADLTTASGPTRDAAADLVQSWLRENTAWHGVVWRSDVLATRVFAWVAQFDEILRRDQDHTLRRAMLTSIAAQLRHLARTASWEVAGAARLRALKGLIAGRAALGDSATRLGKALKALEREVQVQILPDGGHLSRNPSMQLQVLQDLIDTRAVLRAAQIETPDGLQYAIEQMAPILRFQARRSPPRAVQRLAGGRRGSYRPGSDAVRDQGGRTDTGAPDRLRSVAGRQEPRNHRYRETATARVRSGRPRRHAVF